MSDMYRISVSLPDSIKADIEKLKKEKYYNLPYSEIYRQVISLGLNEVNKRNTMNNRKEGIDYEKN